MANWIKPLITDLYTQVLDWLKDRDTDLAKGLDPAAVTVENPQAGFIRYSSANRRWEKFDGTSWAPLATSYAINADTASNRAATITTFINIACYSFGWCRLALVASSIIACNCAAKAV